MMLTRGHPRAQRTAEKHPPRPRALPGPPRAGGPHHALPLRSCSMAASPHVPHFDPQSPVFRAHEGGKLGVHATQPLRGREDLALLYTPGVAEVSLAIAADPSLST